MKTIGFLLVLLLAMPAFSMTVSVFNKSGEDQTIQGHTIHDQESYEIPTGLMCATTIAWMKDLSLRKLMYDNRINILLGGDAIYIDDALILVKDIATGATNCQ